MRVGITVKPQFVETRDLLLEIEEWLKARGAEAVWASDAAGLLPPGDRAVLDRDTLPRAADVILILGGDGTLLAMADHIARAGVDIPILGVNFGSLGFLTEVTRPEIFTSLEAVLAGRATHDERMMLRAEARLDAAAVESHVALNDIVSTRTARSRLI